MRTILHVDMNAYFASVEQAANPNLRGKPVAVGGGVSGKRSVVAAASYEAKARGVKTGMPAWEALKVCPDLIMIAGNMQKYIYTSKEIVKIFAGYTPLVEVFSIDEAFLDVAETKNHFGGEIEIAKDIKKRIRERFHLTCSIGIGPNKLLAKLAGELKKPDGLVVIKAEDVPEKLKDIPVSTLCGVGRKLEKYLGELGIRTFGDLNKYPREKLVKRFGMVGGEQLYHLGQGIDRFEVLPGDCREEAKSMGHSYTLPKNTNDLAEVKSYLLRLCEQVGRRLRRDNYKGRVIHLYVRFGDFTGFGRQKKLSDYIDDGWEIFKAAEKILDRLNHSKSIRLVGVSVSGLIRNTDQLSLFEEKENRKKVLMAVDRINDRWGEFTVERLALLKTVLHGKVGMVAPQMYNPR